MDPAATCSFGVAYRRSAAVAMALLCVAAPASAGVYKCQGDDGRPIYQEAPCPKGRELRDFDKDPPTLTVLPIAPPGTAKRPPAPPLPEGKRWITDARAKRSTATGNPAERKFLAPGINEGEVVARVGPPDIRSSSGRKTARWTYMPTPEDPHTVTTLKFEHGRLIEVERKIVR
jgi:hypothetical protein